MILDILVCLSNGMTARRLSRTARSGARRGQSLCALLLIGSLFGPGTAQASVDMHFRQKGDGYAARALRAHDFDAAERILAPVDRRDADDPGRLINLARVYAATNRRPEARQTLRLVLRLPEQKVVLDNGKVLTSTDAATEMLSRIGRRD